MYAKSKKSPKKVNVRAARQQRGISSSSTSRASSQQQERSQRQPHQIPRRSHKVMDQDVDGSDVPEDEELGGQNEDGDKEESGSDENGYHEERGEEKDVYEWGEDDVDEEQQNPAKSNKQAVVLSLADARKQAIAGQSAASTKPAIITTSIKKTSGAGDSSVRIVISKSISRQLITGSSNKSALPHPERPTEYKPRGMSFLRNAMLLITASLVSTYMLSPTWIDKDIQLTIATPSFERESILFANRYTESGVSYHSISKEQPSDNCEVGLALFERGGEHGKYGSQFAERKLVDHEYNSSESNFIGSIIFPERKLLICTMAKSSSSNIRALLLRMHSLHASDEEIKKSLGMNPDERIEEDASAEHQRISSFLKAAESNSKAEQGDSKGPTDLPSLHHLVTESDWLKHNNVPEFHRQLRNLPIDQIQKIADDRSWLKVAIVRNPFFRLASAYVEKIQSKKMELPGYPTGKLPTFEEYINIITTVEDAKQLSDHFREQSSLCGFDYIDYDYIIQVEHDFQQHFRCIAHKAGFLRLVDTGWGDDGASSLFSVRFGHERGNHAHLNDSDLYTHDLAKKVYMRYIKDFVWFGYKPDLFEMTLANQTHSSFALSGSK